MIRSASQGIDFYIIGTLVLKELSEITFLKREAVVWTQLENFGNLQNSYCERYLATAIFECIVCLILTNTHIWFSDET